MGSQKGRGQLRIQANVHAKWTGPQNNASACAYTDFMPSESQKDIIRSHLRMLTQAWYFTTDGRHFISDWKLWWNQDASRYCPARINFSPILFSRSEFGAGARCVNCCESWCGDPGDRVEFDAALWCAPAAPQRFPIDANTLCTRGKVHKGRFWPNASRARYFNAFLLSHELGHCIHGLDDERASGRACGHSIMSMATAWTYGLATNVLDFCDEHNGGYDGYRFENNAPHGKWQNNWSCAMRSLDNGLGWPGQGKYTPDPFWMLTDHGSHGPFVEPLVNIHEFSPRSVRFSRLSVRP